MSRASATSGYLPRGRYDGLSVCVFNTLLIAALVLPCLWRR